MTLQYQICTRCVMDTTDPEISFDNQGVCSHCHMFDTVHKLKWTPTPEGEKNLLAITKKIKETNKNKRYDCIIGLSGGVDSSYLLYLIKEKYGLRPLAFHLDAGWNSDHAVSNIKSLVTKLGVDLHTEVVNWNEMRDLQRAFLKAGLANQDTPQDHAIFAALYNYANKNDVKWVVSGSNIASESILPKAWGYDAMDWVHASDVHKKFGERQLKTFPRVSWFKRYIYYPYIKRMQVLKPLNYIDYNKDMAKKFLIENMGWQDYGGKHHESRFTKFFQSYYLPKKFGYDKRRAHLSSMILAGHLSRDEALRKIQPPPYDEEQIHNEKDFFAKKLNFTPQELDALIAGAKRDFTEFKNTYGRTKKVRDILKRFKASVA